MGADLSLERQADPWGYEVKAAFLRAEKDGEMTAERYLARVRGERALQGRWSVFVGLSGEQDRFAGFDLRAVVAAGTTTSPSRVSRPLTRRPRLRCC